MDGLGIIATFVCGPHRPSRHRPSAWGRRLSCFSAHVASQLPPSPKPTMKLRLTLHLLLTFTLAVFPSCSHDDELDVSTIPAKVPPLQPSTECVPLIAHRGCWSGSEYPQNSVAAFREALKLNIYGTEFDVRQTRNGRLVVNHDATYKGLAVEDFDYDDLSQQTLSNGEPLPLLEDFLRAYVETLTSVQLVVELKKCRVADVLDLLGQYDVLNRAIFISFSKSYCNQLVKAGYGPVTYYLGGNLSPQAIQKAGYAGIDYRHSVLLEHPEWITEAQALGLQVITWTVNDMTAIQVYIDERVIVTTDQPQRVIENEIDF